MNKGASLMDQISSSRTCRKAKAYLIKARIPSEEEAKVTKQRDGHVEGIRVIPKSPYNRWKRIRFIYHTYMKKLGIRTDLGYLVVENRLDEVLKLLRYVEAELKAIEKELVNWINNEGKEYIKEFIAKYGHLPAWVKPASRFSYVIIPLELCEEDYHRLISQTITGES